MRRTVMTGVAALAFGIAAAGFSQQQGATTQATSQPVVIGATVMMAPFKNAPYPHASRAEGWKYKETVYPKAGHYDDSTVGIVVPAEYRPGAKVNYVIHFHGWGNDAANVIRQYRLGEQLVASGANAILLVPQGPKRASDSGGGHLELDAGAAKALVDEVTAYLEEKGTLAAGTELGDVTLTAHSGGYKVTAAIAAIGGLGDHLTDILLMDASYGSLEKFTAWMQENPQRRLVSLYTDHLADENATLMGQMRAAGVAVRELEEKTLAPDAFAGRGATFVHTTLTHNEVSTKTEYFRRLVSTARLR